MSSRQAPPLLRPAPEGRAPKPLACKPQLPPPDSHWSPKTPAHGRTHPTALRRPLLLLGVWADAWVSPECPLAVPAPGPCLQGAPLAACPFFILEALVLRPPSFVSGSHVLHPGPSCTRLPVCVWASVLGWVPLLLLCSWSPGAASWGWLWVPAGLTLVTPQDCIFCTH